MIRFLQLNLNHCEAAQDLLLQTLVEQKSDVAVVSAPYRIRPSGNSVCSGSSKAAIIVCSTHIPPLTKVKAARHYIRGCIGKIFVYSCYFSPSLSFDELCGTVDELAADARLYTPCLIAGDFNAWAVDWGSTYTNSRAVLEAFAQLDITLLNSRNTFNRAGYFSVIDLTFVSSSLCRKATWQVGNFYTASDHEAILTVLGSREILQVPIPQEKAYRASSLRGSLFKSSLNEVTLQVDSAENMENCLASSVLSACDSSMNIRRTYAGPHRPVFWWNETISERQSCFAARRRYQRARKSGDPSWPILGETFCAANKALKKAIHSSKRSCFLDLCDSAENYPLGRAYKIVVKRIYASKQRPPTDPEMLKGIVAGLFPHTGGEIVSPRISSNLPFAVEPIELEEMRAAAKRLKNGKAPGPDGIQNLLKSTPSACERALSLQGGSSKNWCFSRSLASLQATCLPTGRYALSARC
ncbi:uncharacterized protein [Drosophila tropicalis]|uniref:uncharacterized protein n=1 Tax=Drosophila tropicalis TaxID=46794 RepID=UPI0035ABF6C0